MLVAEAVECLEEPITGPAQPSDIEARALNDALHFTFKQRLRLVQLMHGGPALAHLKPLVDAIDEFVPGTMADDFDNA